MVDWRGLALVGLLALPTTAGAQADGALQVDIRPWAGGRVPIAFDASATPRQQQRLFTACAQWSAVADVQCVRRTTEVPYLRVIRFGGGCAAGIGAPAGEFNYLNLQESCYGEALAEWFGDTPASYYALVHELGHVFGLIHEHQREDRDAHLQVDWAQVRPEFKTAYLRVQSNLPQLTPYDYQSVMHYAGPFVGIPAGVTPGGVTVSALDGQDLAAIYGPRRALHLELLSGCANPVRLQWGGGGNAHPYYVLAGSTPGAWDYAFLPMGEATALTAHAPSGVLIYVTIGAGTSWENAVFSNTVTVKVP